MRLNRVLAATLAALFVGGCSTRPEPDKLSAPKAGATVGRRRNRLSRAMKRPRLRRPRSARPPWNFWTTSMSTKVQKRNRSNYTVVISLA